MQLERLILYFETSPSVKLFRSQQNAPFIVDFLFRTFKKTNKIAISHSELLGAFIEYKESVNESHPEVLKEKPEQYLTSWCSGENRWLRRFTEANRNEPVYQLTSHLEDVVTFIEGVLDRDVGFVGTDSRLRLVIDTLQDLVAGSTKDPDVRLKHLNEARAKIDEEVFQLHSGKAVDSYEPAEVRERFATAVALLKQLMGDFRAVEDRFKEITRQVQQRQMEGRETRGTILGFALDSEEVLKKDDQGVSFYEFVRFILDPAQQDRLHQLITELQRLEELSTQQEGLSTLRRMVPALLAEAEKVMRTNQRLSSTLRRLLDSRSASERQRLAALLGEIKAAALSLSADPPLNTVGLSVDTVVDVHSPFSRTFWTKPTEFVSTDITASATNEEERLRLFRSFSELHRLDWKAMRQRIKALTALHVAVTWRDLFEEGPPEGGVVEVLGYIQIAKDDKHLIQPEKHEDIIIRYPTPEHSGLKLIVPKVIYMPLIEGLNASANSVLPT